MKSEGSGNVISLRSRLGFVSLLKGLSTDKYYKADDNTSQLQTFNMEDALNTIGGFGNLQILTLILLITVRSIGLWHL